MALIKCRECGHDVSTLAMVCQYCGCPVKDEPLPAPSQKRIQTKFHRLPNGFGQIRKLQGKRRCPYVALPPTKGYNDKGNPKIGKPLGYFATYKEAYDCLSEWNNNPYDPSQRALTFKQVYEAFYKEKFEGAKTYSVNTKGAYSAPYKHCEILYDKTYASLRQEDFMGIIKGTNLKYSSLELILNLFKQMDKWAMQHDCITKSYAQFCYIPVPDDDEHGQPFTEEELRKLFNHSDDADVRMILVMCYTGFRISAYETIKLKDDCFVGGVKTKASKDRTVPIHPCVRAWAKDIVGMKKPAISRKFKLKMEELGMNHTPHDTRHTFSWLLTSSGCNELTRRKLMGHSLGTDVEATVYTHKTLEELQEAVQNIKCYAIVR